MNVSFSIRQTSGTPVTDPSVNQTGNGSGGNNFVADIFSHEGMERHIFTTAGEPTLAGLNARLDAHLERLHSL